MALLSFVATALVPSSLKNTAFVRQGRTHHSSGGALFVTTPFPVPVPMPAPMPTPVPDVPGESDLPGVPDIPSPVQIPGPAPAPDKIVDPTEDPNVNTMKLLPTGTAPLHDPDFPGSIPTIPNTPNPVDPTAPPYQPAPAPEIPLPTPSTPPTRHPDPTAY